MSFLQMLLAYGTLAAAFAAALTTKGQATPPFRVGAHTYSVTCLS